MPSTTTFISNPSFIQTSLYTFSNAKLVIHVASSTTANTFEQQVYVLKFSWIMALRIAINILLAIMVIFKTPLAREMKKLRKTTKQRNNLDEMNY